MLFTFASTIVQEMRADWMRVALALTWGFAAGAAVLGISAYRSRGRFIRGLQSQLRGVRFEAAKTQILPDWLVSRRCTVVDGGLANLPRFKLPAERAPQLRSRPVDSHRSFPPTLPAIEHPE